jgi:hypothetical protein
MDEEYLDGFGELPDFEESHINEEPTIHLTRSEDVRAVNLRAFAEASFANDYENVVIASLNAVMAYVPFRLRSTLDLEFGDYTDYCHHALYPLYHKDKLSRRRWNSIGGDGDESELLPRLVYIDKVVVHPQIASRDLGMRLVASAMRSLFFTLGRFIPVVAILGAYDRRRQQSAKSIRTYFGRAGFRRMLKSDDLPHFLPEKVIRDYPHLDDTVIAKKKSVANS